MIREKFLLVGSGGREAAFALKLYESCTVCAILSHENPTIVDCVTKSKGEYEVSKPSEPQTVLAFAQKCQPDYVFVSADEPLANGVVDILLAHNFKAVGGTKDACRIEWDKVYAIEMMNKLCPSFTPKYFVVNDEAELEIAIDYFRSKSLNLVVKPNGLTGGKGVKVMPIHLQTYELAQNYANELLQSNGSVLLVEKIEGIEFTIMCLTDGKNSLLCPATYDYPYRFDGDQGPGTGGMGCLTGEGYALPFLTETDLLQCKKICEVIIKEMNRLGLDFKGILNAGFFKTSEGIKFLEFNSRFGDPEALNIMLCLKSSFSELIKSLWHKNLNTTKVEFDNTPSVVKYLVAKEYPNESPTELEFSINFEGLQTMQVECIFASCVKNFVKDKKNSYKTIKKSRVFAFGAKAKSTEEAANQINIAIANFVEGPLEFRKDIGISA